MLEAKIILDYRDETLAKAVARAVSPDNVKTPQDLSVETVWKGGKVFTTIKCEGKLSTLIATIDDLLSSVSSAEKAVQTARKFA
jgi:tRNA threonylcarbamoyladenosine modification (KEOPS) complex  Pcc1 subunit